MEEQLPIDRSSECARARLSTNMTSTSKTNCSTKEFSSLQRQEDIVVNQPRQTLNIKSLGLQKKEQK